MHQANQLSNTIITRWIVWVEGWAAVHLCECVYVCLCTVRVCGLLCVSIYASSHVYACASSCLGVFSCVNTVYLCVFGLVFMWMCVSVVVSVWPCLCVSLSECVCVSWFEMSALNSHPLWFLFCSAQGEAGSANLSPLRRCRLESVPKIRQTDRQIASYSIQTSWLRAGRSV